MHAFFRIFTTRLVYRTGWAGGQASRQTFCPFLVLGVHQVYLYAFILQESCIHNLCLKFVIVYYLNSQDWYIILIPDMMAYWVMFVMLMSSKATHCLTQNLKHYSYSFFLWTGDLQSSWFKSKKVKKREILNMDFTKIHFIVLMITL